ncbi:MAG: S1 RNA-binding domain-containing protein [Clostridia bacterium]|nr:S1 RNA-binding domain-containing protein [Clostridia bacterium]
MTNTYKPEGMAVETAENRERLISRAAAERAFASGAILEAPAVMCDSELSLSVDLGFSRGVIPKDEAIYLMGNEKFKDIAVLTRVGKTVCFKITGFERQNGEPIVMLSRRKAQLEFVENGLPQMKNGDIIDARITHCESFGAFADVGCGIVALMPIDCISVSRITHPKERFFDGMFIKAAVRCRDAETGRLFLSHKELLGTFAENCAAFSAGQTVAGTVRGVEPYGVFVELAPNLAGLADVRDGIVSGQSATVYIKSIFPERMKIKLVILDVGEPSRPPKKFDYFIKEGRIERWVYSPPESKKTIETVF